MIDLREQAARLLNPGINNLEFLKQELYAVFQAVAVSLQPNVLNDSEAADENYVSNEGGTMLKRGDGTSTQLSLQHQRPPRPFGTPQGGIASVAVHRGELDTQKTYAVVVSGTEAAGYDVFLLNEVPPTTTEDGHPVAKSMADHIADTMTAVADTPGAYADQTVHAAVIGDAADSDLGAGRLMEVARFTQREIGTVFRKQGRKTEPHQHQRQLFDEYVVIRICCTGGGGGGH